MKTRKSFAAPPPVHVATVPPQRPLDETANLAISVPENHSRFRTLDLTPWLGQGIDAWVWACAGQLRACLTSKEVAASTVTGYWTIGLRRFFKFLTTGAGPANPAQLEPCHIRLYLGWLAEQGWAYGSQKTTYDHTKAVLTALTRRQVVPDQAGLFPVNPFPKSNSRRSKGAEPLSSGERLRLAQALRNDLVAIHQGHFDGPDSAAQVTHLLGVAIRTGATPPPPCSKPRVTACTPILSYPT